MDTTKRFAFFVHECKPLPEPPKPVIAPNDKLPQLVAEMVQKGLNATPKAVKNLNPTTTPEQNCKSIGNPAIKPPTNQQLQNSLRALHMQNQQQQQKVTYLSTFASFVTFLNKNL